MIDGELNEAMDYLREIRWNPVTSYNECRVLDTLIGLVRQQESRDQYIEELEDKIAELQAHIYDLEDERDDFLSQIADLKEERNVS